MKRVILFSASLEIIEYLFIILFTYTSLSKLLDLNTFEFQLHRSPYLEGISNFVSLVIPAVEVIIVFGLVMSKFQYLQNRGVIFDWIRRNSEKVEFLSLCGALFIMALFTGYVAIMLNMAYYLPCSCGGILSSMSWQDHLKFNICFTFLAVVALCLNINSLNNKRI